MLAAGVVLLAVLASAGVLGPLIGIAVGFVLGVNASADPFFDTFGGFEQHREE